MKNNQSNVPKITLLKRRVDNKLKLITIMQFLPLIIYLLKQATRSRLGLGSKLILSYCCTVDIYNEIGVHGSKVKKKKCIVLFYSIYVQCQAADFKTPEQL